MQTSKEKSRKSCSIAPLVAITNRPLLFACTHILCVRGISSWWWSQHFSCLKTTFSFFFLATFSAVCFCYPNIIPFTCLLFSFSILYRVSIERLVSRKAFRCAQSIRYFVYIDTRLMHA